METTVLESFHFIKKEITTQVLSYEFCEHFKNTFFTEHLQWLLQDHVCYFKTVDIKQELLIIYYSLLRFLSIYSI